MPSPWCARLLALLHPLTLTCPVLTPPVHLQPLWRHCAITRFLTTPSPCSGRAPRVSACAAACAAELAPCCAQRLRPAVRSDCALLCAAVAPASECRRRRSLAGSHCGWRRGRGSPTGKPALHWVAPFLLPPSHTHHTAFYPHSYPCAPPLPPSALAANPCVVNYIVTTVDMSEGGLGSEVDRCVGQAASSGLNSLGLFLFGLL